MTLITGVESNRRIFCCVLVYVQIGTSRFESNRRMSQLTVSPISGGYCIYIFFLLNKPSATKAIGKNTNINNILMYNGELQLIY
jgi:hypothetical protein